MRVHLIPSFLISLLAVIAVLSASSTYGQFEVRLTSFTSSKGSSNGVLWELCLTNFQRNPVDNAECGFSEPISVFSSILQRGIAIPLNFTWPGSFSLFIHSRNASLPYNFSDVVFKKVFASENVTANDKWTEVQISDERYGATVVISYRIVCSRGRFGNYCREITCHVGGKILRCTDDGKVVTCAPGWTGEKCDQAVCDGCKQNGQCVGPGICKCDVGWTGSNCDLCMPSPDCKHGTCQKPNDCICHKGWGGNSCDKDLEYCTRYAPCQNGATCLNAGNGNYTCSCRPGYSGVNCEAKQKTCLPTSRRDTATNQVQIDRTCQNGGRCVRGLFGDYHCECQSGYGGDYCQQCTRCCPKDACFNGGTCVSDGSLNNYLCICPIGFTGIRCEDVISICEVENPCLHGGLCVTISNQFMCKCPAGYTGLFCEDSVDPCQESPCENNGLCISVGDGLYECRCSPGYRGKNCDIKVISCEHQPCGNGSTCYQTSSGPQCHCRPCYTGPYCRVVDQQCLLKVANGWNSLSVAFLIVIAILTFLILVMLVIFLGWKCCTGKFIVVDPAAENMVNAQRSRLYQLPSVDSKLRSRCCESPIFRYKPVSVSRLKAQMQCNDYGDHRQSLPTTLHGRDEDLYAELDDSHLPCKVPPAADSNLALDPASELSDLSRHNCDRRSRCLDLHTNV